MLPLALSDSDDDDNHHLLDPHALEMIPTAEFSPSRSPNPLSLPRSPSHPPSFPRSPNPPSSGCSSLSRSPNPLYSAPSTPLSSASAPSSPLARIRLAIHNYEAFEAPSDARKASELKPCLRHLHPDPETCRCAELARLSLLDLHAIGSLSSPNSPSPDLYSPISSPAFPPSERRALLSLPHATPSRSVFDGSLSELPHSPHGAPLSRSQASLEELLDEAEDASLLQTFPKSLGLSRDDAQRLLEEFGPNQLPEVVVPPWLVFAKLLFWEPMPVILWLAAVVEFALTNYIDGVILVLIVLTNASLSFYELQKAGNAVAALKASMRPFAIVSRDGAWDHHHDAAGLVPGDLVQLCIGNVVPADCMVNEGSIDVDESAMTGETLPVTLRARQLAKMGSTVVRGECEATVLLTGPRTFFGRTAAMLGSAGERRSNLYYILRKIMVGLLALPLAYAGAALAYLLATGSALPAALNFAVALVVASAPLAMEIVTTTTLALGSRQLSDEGAIVTRLTAIEDMAGLNVLCSDKTGTLTKNKMEIQQDAPPFAEGMDQMALLRHAALAARWTAPPKDALDTLILRCHLWIPDFPAQLADYRARNAHLGNVELEAWAHGRIEAALMDALADYECVDHVPFDPTVKRTESTVRVRSTQQLLKVTKGAPHIIGALDQDLQKRHAMEMKVTELGEDGVRCMAVAVSEPLDDSKPVVWRMLGLLTFLDPPRDDTKHTVEMSGRLGVPVRMVTGDHLLIARKTCRDLEMGDRAHPEWPNIQGPADLPRLGGDGKAPPDLVERYGHHITSADGFAQVWPEHKFLIVQCFRDMGYKCGMTGDGVNDAPALKAADVGIAVAGATEAARAAADIILTKEGLSTIIVAIDVARVIFKRMKAFLIYRIGVSLYMASILFLSLFLFSPSDVFKSASDAVEAPPDFFQVPVIFLIILTVLNDGCIIAIGYDNATASRTPETWHFSSLLVSSISLCVLPIISSLVFIGMACEAQFGITHYGHVSTASYYFISVSAFLTIFSARVPEGFFFQTMPHKSLFAAATVALGISTLVALFWPESTLDEVAVLGLAYQGGFLIPLWIWLIALFVFLLQDTLKYLVFRICAHYHLFGFSLSPSSSSSSTSSSSSGQYDVLHI